MSSGAQVTEDVVAYGRISYASLMQGAFSETGLAPYDFAFAKADHSVTRGSLGLRLSHVFTLNDGTLILPDISVALSTLMGPASVLSATLADASNNDVFRVPVAQTDRARPAVKLGITE